MSVASHQIPGGARVLLFSCDVCGKPACFGEGVQLLQALKSGKVEMAGRWFCARHRPRERKDDLGEVA